VPRLAAPLTFLTAAWRYLAMLNFRIDPAVLLPLVPADTELDTWNGDALVSVVGFRFLETRVFGVPLLFHGNFTEVNLRFYVRRRINDGVRRAVTFVREIVPKPAITVVARALYNEPYRTCPMRAVVPDHTDVADPGRVEYAWRQGGRWHAVHVRSTGAPLPLTRGSEEEFITEHFWGYTAQRDGSTLEYEVRHPSWCVWQVSEAGLDCDVRSVYGERFADALSAPPCSAFLAEGSEVSVSLPRSLDP
jgi:uncharacterized protein YqjF (DUF2071 family)